jgi:hypothetical protein
MPSDWFLGKTNVPLAAAAGKRKVFHPSQVEGVAAVRHPIEAYYVIHCLPFLQLDSEGR